MTKIDEIVEAFRQHCEKSLVGHHCCSKHDGKRSEELKIMVAVFRLSAEWAQYANPESSEEALEALSSLLAVAGKGFEAGANIGANEDDVLDAQEVGP